jgi:hypothetical protein
MSAAAAVDHVFNVLGATYGSAWERSLGTAPIADVKTAWGYALSDFLHSQDAKQAIFWGLKNLPDTVPNPRQFRSLCQRAPSKAPVMLPAPVVNPEIAAKVIDGLRAQTIWGQSTDPKAWARKILDDYAAGMKKSPTVVQLAKNALKEAA